MTASPSARPLQAMTTLAMLKTYLDTGQDYLAIFVPFLLQAIAARRDPAFSASEIQLSLAEQFGLTIPETTIATLLQRLQKQGVLKREGGRFLRHTVGSPSGFEAQRRATEEELQRLAQTMAEYVARVASEVWSAERALAVVVEFVDQYRVELVRGGVNPVPDQRALRLASMFLGEVCVEGSPFGLIAQRLLEGVVLESTLLLRDIKAPIEDFRGLDVYLDTTVLLRLLGYYGKGAVALAQEMARLLGDTGARLAAFDVTIEEIHRLLAVYRDHLLTKEGRESLRPTEMTRFFLTSGLSSGDVTQEMATFPKRLTQLGIRVVQVPRRQREYQRDERSLQELLRRPGGNADEPRVLHDVDCVMGIEIIRKGKPAVSWERAGAVFATMTGEVVAKVDRWHAQSGDSGLPPVIHLSRLANIAWLKRPRVGSALKQHELIALCHTLLRPSEEAWKRFKDHLRKLEDSGQVTSDEAAAVLASEFTDKALESFDIGDDVDADTVGEVIERVRQTYRDEAAGRVAEIEEAASARIAAAEETARLERSRREEEEAKRRREEHAAEELRSRVARRALFLGRAVALIISLGVAVALVLAALRGQGLLGESVSPRLRVSVTVAVIIACVFGTLGDVFGISVGTLHRWLPRRLASAVKSWLLARPPGESE